MNPILDYARRLRFDVNEEPFPERPGIAIVRIEGVDYLVATMDGFADEKRRADEVIEAMARALRTNPGVLRSVIFDGRNGNNMSKTVQLGDTVEDKISGFHGAVTSLVQNIAGPDQALIQPRTLDEKGELREPKWFDVKRLDVDDSVPRIVLDDGTSPDTVSIRVACEDKRR